MLSVILLILKIIGIVILSILALILTLIMILLFVPIRYRAYGHKGTEDNDYGGLLNVSFLLHILSVTAKYEDKFELIIKVFGIRIRRGEEKPKKEKKTKKKTKISDIDESRVKKEDVKEETSSESVDADVSEEEEVTYEIDWNEDDTEVNAKDSQGPQKVEKQEESDESAKEEEDSEVKEEKESISDKIDKLIEKITGFFDKGEKLREKIVNRARDFEKKITNITGFLDDYRNKRAINYLWIQIKYLLKKLAPKKTRGNIHFGFDDPATTGQTCMYIGMFAPFLPGKIEYYPDFEDSHLFGEIHLKGRFALISLLIVLLRLYFDKDVKRAWNIYKGKNN